MFDFFTRLFSGERQDEVICITCGETFFKLEFEDFRCINCSSKDVEYLDNDLAGESDPDEHFCPNCFDERIFVDGCCSDCGESEAW